MKRHFYSLMAVALVLGGLFVCGCQKAAVAPAIAADPRIEKEVEALLKGLTLEEKIGQMTQLNADVLGTIGPDMQLTVDPQKLHEVIAVYKVGSILNTPGPLAQTPERWAEFINPIQELSLKEIGIPCLYGLDMNHGASYTAGATLFPQNINVAATFNRDLAREAGRVTAYETKASSCPWTFSPTMDLSRDPRWPRLWENFGEDCLVNAEMGAAVVRGMQGEDPNHVDREHIAACLKHYMGYGVPRTGKDRTPAYISEQELREKHFAPYKRAIEAGALSIMVNSGSINGTPVHANYDLLTKWLKEDLNWDGMIVTDWADIENLHKREKVAANKKEAIKLAINAGIDMSMDPYNTDFCTLLKELVEEGEVPMSRIDDAVRRVLRLKFRLGLFENPYYNLADYPKFGGEEHRLIALQAAEESMVLLKNNNALLPLPEGKRYLVTGPNAHTMRGLNGGWSYTWQGHLAALFTDSYNTILEAVQNRFGKQNVVYEPGVTYNEEGNYWEENTPQIERAVAAACSVDYILCCIGENSYCETPGNLSDLTLSRNQLDLVKALAKTGKPIVLILNEGRPRLISEIEPLAAAVVDVMLPSNSGGDALANLLSGDANFSGKLPFTYPKENGSLTTYDHKSSEQSETMAGAYDYNAEITVQWAFGYGLSYTTFAYSNLRVDKEEFKAGDELCFTVDLTNTGDRVGKEAVLLFSSDLVASLVPDSRRLRAFEKVELQPGETRSVELRIPASDLAFVGYDKQWRLEKGDFRMQVGNQTVIVRCTEEKVWNTPNK